MPCFYPVKGYLGRNINTSVKTGLSTGKRSIVFDKALGFVDKPMTVPCGICTGCLLAKATSWATRSMHEASLHPENAFITLTYAPEHLPEPPFVSVETIQKFLKKLRSHLHRKAEREKKPTPEIKYLACGEYGSKTYRPHYHLLIFNWRPKNGTKIRNTPFGNVFVSQELQKLWTLGLSEYGSVTPASAGYVARYTTKKLFERGMQGSEFLLASRKPALGIDWLKNHYKEVYSSDCVRIGGKSYRPPITYDRWLEKNHLELYKEVTRKRAAKVSTPEAILDNDSFRLPVKEASTIDRIRGLKREVI